MTKTNRKTVVLFDIDYTLFNTEVYRQTLYQKLADALGYSFDEFLPIAEEIGTTMKATVGHFSPKDFLAYLYAKRRKDVSEEELEGVFWDEVLYSESLYKDVKSVVKELQGRDVTIGILSTGNLEHQKRKITLLHDLFEEDHMHIFVDKIAELKHVVAKYKEDALYIIDDIPAVLAEAKKYNPSLTTILIKQKKEQEPENDAPGFIPDREIGNLQEILGIIARQ